MEQTMPGKGGFVKASSRSRSPYLSKASQNEELGKIAGETGTPAYQRKGAVTAKSFVAKSSRTPRVSTPAENLTASEARSQTGGVNDKGPKV